MARSIWKGSIRFGLVTIPVGLFNAEEVNELHFHLLDKEDMKPLHYQRVSSATGKEVPWDQTTRGYEYAKGKYLAISDSDLKRASPEATQSIDILTFVDLSAITPLYFERPYYLAPDKKGAKSYALLRETLRRTNKAGIAKVVIRTRQHLAAMFALDDVIVLDLLRFDHELRDSSQLDLPRGKQGISAKELQMAERLVTDMVEDWKPAAYEDDFQDSVRKLIAQRVKSGKLDATEEEPAPKRSRGGNVVDLMALLKRSVEEGRRPAAPAASKTRSRGKAAVQARKGTRTPARRARRSRT
jgi:DNA end-binding protein Ku